MDPKILIAALDTSEKFFDRSTSILTEEDSTFAPSDGMYTAAQSVGHVAGVIDWFIDGAFVRPDGFSMDFEALDAEARAFTSLDAARAKLKEAFASARKTIEAQSPEALLSLLPDGYIMPKLPRLSIVSGIEDHTAHHRGALTVYARLRGKTPAMPYEGD